MWKKIGFLLAYILRNVVSWIDGLIYTADAELYDLIAKIARQRVFSDSTLTEVASRVYQLVALIMMFRLIFLFVSYVVNPDAMVDKTKGYQNIVKKLIITMVLIIVTPWAFTQARNVQQVILEEGVIEYLVFGQSSNSSTSSGYEFMYTVGKLFVTPYKCTSDDCSLVNQYDDNSTDNLCESAKWNENIAVSLSDGTLNCAGSKTCKGLCGLGANDNSYARSLFKASYASGDKYDLRALMGLGGAGSIESSTYYAEYKYPFVGTTLIGIIIGYMLIVMCIDIAVRTVKLSFYELMAPIPIVSYIGPKDGKETLLNKWFNQVLKTYADLFTRLAGLEIAIFFINTMLKDDSILKSGDFFVELFLILGALTFAKQLPKILESLGIKFETGSFSLKKSLAPLAPAAGMAAGALGGMIGNYQGSRATGRGGFTSALSAAAGAVPGALRGGMAGLKAKDEVGVGKAFAAAGKGGQNIYNRYGTSTAGRYAAKFQSAVGAKTEGERMDETIKANETYSGFKKTLKDNADFYTGSLSTADISGGAAKSYTRSSNATTISNMLSTKGVKNIKQYYEDLQKSGTATYEELNAAREAYEDAQQYVIGNARRLSSEGNNAAAQSVANQLQSIKSQAARYAHDQRGKLGQSARTISTREDASWDELNQGFIDASNEAVRIRTTEEYSRAQANKNWGQTGKSGKK